MQSEGRVRDVGELVVGGAGETQMTGQENKSGSVHHALLTELTMTGQ